MTIKEDVHDNEVKWLAYQNKYAAKMARTWFDDVIKTLHNAAEDIERYKNRFDVILAGDYTGKTTPEDVMSGAVMSVASIQGNLRLDMAVILAARLARANDVIAREDELERLGDAVIIGANGKVDTGHAS